MWKPAIERHTSPRVVHHVIKYDKELNMFYVMIGASKHYVRKSDYYISDSCTIYSNLNNDVWVSKITRYYVHRPGREETINRYYAKLFDGQKVVGSLDANGIYCVERCVTN